MARRATIEQGQSWILAIWIALSMVLGGGGSPNPASELVLQLSCAALLVVYVFLEKDTPTHQTFSRSIMTICALAVAIPLVQLIPLPAAIWHNLPGRDAMRDALALIDEDMSWRAFSIAPHLTLAGLLAILPPAVLAILVARQPVAVRTRLLGIIAFIALASITLGGLQIADGGTAFRLYPDAHLQWLTGFHANRNAAADVLLIGAMASACWWASQAKRTAPVLLLVVALLLFAIGVIATGSRAGIVLLPVAGVGTAILLSLHALVKPGRAVGACASLLTFVSAILLWLSYTNTRIATVAARFSAAGDARFDLWRDSWTAMRAYWPWGTGIGTFVPAFLPHERIETIDATMPNRAHNDYLELAIEAGLPGLLILAVIAVLVIRLALLAWKNPRVPRAHTIFALQTFIVIALHALVDYPLRNMAIASLAGVALGLLSPPRVGTGSGS